jgi:hypothetical protein
MIERHHDYVLRNIGITPNGQKDFVVLMDFDAPFALRTLFGAASMNYFSFQLIGFDDRFYQQGTVFSNVTVDSLLNTPGSFFMFYPQITMPIQGAFRIRLKDLSGAGIDGGVLVFRGTKIYPSDTSLAFGPQYPPNFAELNFRYPFNFTIPLGTGANPTVLQHQPFNIKPDADFVFRMGASFVQPGADAYDAAGVDCVLRDQYGKPFSSDSTGPSVPGWVPLHLLFPVPNNSSRISIPDVTIYPEIYVQRNTQLLFDIRRTSGTQNTTYNIVLHGSKIFQVSQ